MLLLLLVLHPALLMLHAADVACQRRLEPDVKVT